MFGKRVGRFSYLGLKNRPEIYSRYLKFGFLKGPLNWATQNVYPLVYRKRLKNCHRKFVDLPSSRSLPFHVFVYLTQYKREKISLLSVVILSSPFKKLSEVSLTIWTVMISYHRTYGKWLTINMFQQYNAISWLKRIIVGKTWSYSCMSMNIPFISNAGKIALN